MFIQDSLSDKKSENETAESSSESVEVSTSNHTHSRTLCPLHFDTEIKSDFQAKSPNDEEKNEAADSKETSDSSHSIAVSNDDRNVDSPTESRCRLFGFFFIQDQPSDTAVRKSVSENEKPDSKESSSSVSTNYSTNL